MGGVSNSITDAAMAGDAAQLVQALGETHTQQRAVSLFMSLAAAYHKDPAATTATLAHALQLANNDQAKAEAAAIAMTAALVNGGRLAHREACLAITCCCGGASSACLRSDQPLGRSGAA
jgi:hypothetical protein